MRSTDHDVRSRHADFFLDRRPRPSHQIVPRDDNIQRHNRRFRLTIIQHEHTRSQRIAHAVDHSSMPGDRQIFHLLRRNIHLRRTGLEIRDDRKSPIHNLRRNARRQQQKYEQIFHQSDLQDS